jgi:hypothetical protein
MDKDLAEHLVKTLESIADYASMLKGAMGHLTDAGLSPDAAEAVLMSLLDIPGWVAADDDDDDDEYDYTVTFEFSDEDDDTAE